MAARDSADLHRLARAMCSVDLAESQWTQELPRLPVPDLWLTVSRYLASLKAVLAPTQTQDEMLHQIGYKLTRNQIEANWRQYERTDQLVKQFMLNEGPELQRDLKEYANKCQNWATEFWLQDMYLSNPVPLPVNSNPFFLFPRQQFGTSNEMLMFATRIIQFSVDFKYRIDQQALRQDFGSGHGKGKAMCMETYKNFFHSYRMPHENMDRLLPQSRRSNHIVVASCNQFYILRLGQDPLDNPYRRDTSSQMNEASIFEQLLRIYRVSREHTRREQSNGNGNGSEGSGNGRHRSARVGLLTCEDRKEWARLHKRLSHCNANSAVDGGSASLNTVSSSGSSSPNTNTESLRLIEDCLFVMCLDSLVGGGGGSQQQQHHKDANKEPVDEVKAASIILTGGGTHLFTANRWFDKFLQIIVGRDGTCGICIEHSASEGITVLRFVEEFLEFIASNPLTHSIKRLSVTAEAAFEDGSDESGVGAAFNYELTSETKPDVDSRDGTIAPNASSSITSITSPSYVEPKSPSLLLEESDKITPLMWHLDQDLWRAIDEAELKVNRSIENFNLVIKKFTHFGRRFIKSQNMSPDAFVQLALQYTFYKLHGCLVSTYESASLRQFRLGRVDNIRANTCEAHQWIQEMLACKQNQTKAGTNRADFEPAETSFIRAITKQVEILRYTIVGGAPDNHLLALRELAKIRYGCAPDDAPDLFQDPSYREFLNFRLSTSQLPNESGITVGYGAVVGDGYGCSYNPCDERIIFCVSSFNDCPETSSSNFAEQLEESLLEMQQLCSTRAAKNTKTK